MNMVASVSAAHRRLLSFSELKSLKGINDTRQTIWRKVKAKTFPKPVKHGQRNAWVEEEVDAYIDALIDQRDQGGDHDQGDDHDRREH
jgi:predicted DNA-binding transcriptional regulator AlpA